VNREEVVVEQLSDIRDRLKEASDQLLDERDAAANDPAKVAVAETEFDRIAVVLSSVQTAINQQLALNLNAVATRLQDSIEAQRAIGLSTAAATLEDLVERIRGSLASPTPGRTDTGQPPAPPPQPPRGEAPQDHPPPQGQPPQRPGSSGLQAKPGKHQAIIDKLIAGAKAENLEPLTVLTIVAIESDFNPTATNPVSSAGGLFKFLDATWVSNGGATFLSHGGVGNGQAAAAPVDDQVEIGCRFIAKSIRDLADHLGQPPTLTAIYMAHQQGFTGALKILTSNPAASIESVLGDEAARNNGLSGLTVAQAKVKFDSLVRSHEDETLALVTTAPEIGAAVVAGLSGGSSIAPKAAHIALTEMEMFARRNGAVVTERELPLSQRVLEYFKLVGRPDIVDPSAEPWSAAFISFVMSSAGATATQFPISASHSRYILKGLTNRINNNLDAPLVYFDRNEMAPRVGDLIGFSRTANVKNRSDLERLLPDTFFPSHTDLVIDVSGSKIRVIGGNVSQTIMTTTAIADGSGKIDPSDQHFFLLRLNI
jgi:hypothetical protein